MKVIPINGMPQCQIIMKSMMLIHKAESRKQEVSLASIANYQKERRNHAIIATSISS